MLTDTQTRDGIALLVALRGVPVPASENPEGMVLDSLDIGYKFGFNDGDVPDAVHDMVESYFGQWRHIDRDCWADVLMDLVTTHLLPALGDPPIDGLFKMGTLHNPIRTYEPLPDGFPHGHVTVPWHDVLVTALLHIEAPSR